MNLTDRALQVVRLAHEEALALGDIQVGTDHLLLAMLHDGKGAAASLLEDSGVSYDSVRDGITTEISA